MNLSVGYLVKKQIIMNQKEDKVDKLFSFCKEDQPAVVSTFASPHKPTLKPKACKRASASPARITSFQDGFKIACAQKNKINLCFVVRLVQIENDKKIKAK